MSSVSFVQRNGAIKQNRTADLFLTKEVLYQLSYNGAFFVKPEQYTEEGRRLQVGFLYFLTRLTPPNKTVRLPLLMQTVVILANGQPPVHPTPLALLTNADLLICCDGACLTAQRLGRVPHFIVGDGDSIPPAERAAWADRFILIGEQDTNDLDKAFRFALSRQPVPFHLALLGTTGLREDHTLGNIFRLLAFTEQHPDTVLYTDTGTFEAVRGTQTLSAPVGSPVSIFAPVPGTDVSSSGLQWPLDGVPLGPLWAGTLNRTTGPRFTLCTSRPILVYRPYPDVTDLPSRV